MKKIRPKSSVLTKDYLLKLIRSFPELDAWYQKCRKEKALLFKEDKKYVGR